MYNTDAKKVAVKVIGTVESNLRYDAINYNDPITVGFVQWYGPRARNILNRMRVDNPSAWTGVNATLEQQIIADNINWTGRYLTTTEGNSLIPVLNANAVIQNQQCSEDLEDYVVRAQNYGLDKDRDTDAMIYFFSMYHQGPLYADMVIAECKKEYAWPPSLDQVHAQCMLNGVFNQYRGRYDTTLSMIKAKDGSGIELPGAGGGDTGGGDTGGGETPPVTEPVKGAAVKYLSIVNDSIRIVYSDGQLVDTYNNGCNQYLPIRSITGIVPPVEPPVEGGGGETPPVTGTGKWFHPLPGSSITSPWGPRSFDGFHYGDDFSMSPAGNVTAPTDMVIDVADGTSNASAGYYVSARSVDGKYTFKFYHMVAGSLTVSPGQTVAGGAKIGVMGNTGNSFGAHTHFEVYEGALTNPWPPPYGPMTINPSTLLRANGVTV